jgi:hypothetical protein
VLQIRPVTAEAFGALEGIDARECRWMTVRIHPFHHFVNCVERAARYGPRFTAVIKQQASLLGLSTSAAASDSPAKADSAAAAAGMRRALSAPASASSSQPSSSQSQASSSVAARIDPAIVEDARAAQDAVRGSLSAAKANDWQQVIIDVRNQCWSQAV